MTKDDLNVADFSVQLELPDRVALERTAQRPLMSSKGVSDRELQRSRFGVPQRGCMREGADKVAPPS
jgi:hypothetical protein